MLRAADYRERARASLSGNWGMAVLVCFVGALLGGIQSVIPVTANYQYGEGMSVQIFGINMSLNQLPAEMLGILAVMMSILSIYALAQFVIGGVVELGMCAYFSKRALGENADIKDEFAYFQYFGKALGLRIVTSIFIFLWTMLFIIPGLIATYRYAMAPYIMAEHPEMGIMEAIEASKQMMDGNKWSLFCLDFQFYRLDDFKCMYIWNRRSILKSIYPYGNGSFLSEFKQRFFRKLQFGWNDVKGKNLSLNSYKNVKNLQMDFN